MRIVLLPGDGIGAEVMAEAAKALRVLLPDAVLEEHPLGGAAIERHGDPLPADTLQAALAADAVLMGAVGANEMRWADKNPEDGMFALRAALDVYANIRPFRSDAADLLIVRELVGGLYFGARGVREDGTVFDTLEYHPRQVERIVRKGFALARSRRGRLTSVDKANVLATSRMWRATVDRIAPEFPDVAVDHLLVDTAAMRIVQAPGAFDVIVTENTFGDILSDVAAGVMGGLGEAASACLTDDGPGLFEPVHGTAPDIAGRGIANPVAMLRSTALALDLGLGLGEEARRLDGAIDRVLAETRTPDRGGSATTVEVGDAVAVALQEQGVADVA